VATIEQSKRRHAQMRANGPVESFAAAEISERAQALHTWRILVGMSHFYTVRLPEKFFLSVPRTSSTSCDQPVFTDHATDASVPSDTVQLKIDPFR
jgi:hypothetical protein